MAKATSPRPNKIRLLGSGVDVVVEVIVRILSPSTKVPNCANGIPTTSANPLMGQPLLKAGASSIEVDGLMMSTDAIEQPSVLRTPVVDSLRSDVIVVVVVKMEGTSNEKLYVDGTNPEGTVEPLNV